MTPGKILKEQDAKLDSILVHYKKVLKNSPTLDIRVSDIRGVGLDEDTFCRALGRHITDEIVTVLYQEAMEDLIPEVHGYDPVIARVVYHPKGKRRQKGPTTICDNPTFKKGLFVVCRDTAGDPGVFYDSTRLRVGPKPDRVLAYLLEHNGKMFTKFEIAEVLGTKKVEALREMVRRINNTVETKTKQKVTKIIKGGSKNGYMTDV